MMQILLQRIVPAYLEEAKINSSEIWGQNITLSKGEHVYIIAPSGSGKTSLIHFIYGLRKDFNGTILYGDANISGLSPEKISMFRQKNISIVFQDLRLFANQTVEENLEIKRRLNPYHRAEKITEMATYLGIGSKLGKLAGTCSYGEQQRIAIIRSLMQPFDFLLLDEPFSHLDENNRALAASLIIGECAKRNASMVFADLKQLDFFKEEKTWHL